MQFHFLKIVEHPPGDSSKVQFIPTLTNWHPDLIGPINAAKYGVDATYASIKGTVGTWNMELGISLWMFFFSDMPNIFESKDFSIGGNTYKIYDHTMKYDVYMKGWPFVSDSNLLELTVRILTPNNDTIKTNQISGGVRFDVPVHNNQDFAEIIWPNIVNVDNVLKNFDIQVNNLGDNTDISLEFPSFKDFLDFDPILYVPPRPCGNNILDIGEQCDYGYNGCSALCQCVAPYVPAGQLDCILPDVSNSNANSTVNSNAAVANNSPRGQPTYFVVLVVVAVVVSAIALVMIALFIYKRYFTKN